MTVPITASVTGIPGRLTIEHTKHLTWTPEKPYTQSLRFQANHITKIKYLTEPAALRVSILDRNWREQNTIFVFESGSGRTEVMANFKSVLYSALDLWGVGRLLKGTNIQCQDEPVMNETTSTAVVSEVNMEEAKHLFELPQELLDDIFSLAYPQEDGIYRSREQWELEELEKRRHDLYHTSRPFPPAKVTEFMVSKTFYDNASRAWTANQVFSDDPNQAFATLSYRYSLDTAGIVYQNVTSLNLEHWCSEIGGIYMLPSLKHLTLSAHTPMFECIEPHFAWMEILDKIDLMKVVQASTLMLLSGLRTFVLVPARNFYAQDEGQKNCWERNVQALEDLLRPIVKKPRVRTSKSLSEDDAETAKLLWGSQLSLPDGLEITKKGCRITSEALEDDELYQEVLLFLMERKNDIASMVRSKQVPDGKRVSRRRR